MCFCEGVCVGAGLAPRGDVIQELIDDNLTSTCEHSSIRDVRSLISLGGGYSRLCSLVQNL